MSIKEALRFEQNLYQLINTCGLSLDTAYYILKSVYLDFQQTLMKCAETEGETHTTEEVHAVGPGVGNALEEIINS